MQKQKKLARSTIDEYRNKLEIDPTDLESCLVEQAKLFYFVAEGQAQANAKRDSLKLDIDELHAKLDQDFRNDAVKREIKTTETGIANAIKDDPDYRDLQRQFINAKGEADEWGALKEAFYQRGYMLRELVALQLRQHSMENDVARAERDATSLRHARGEENARKAGEMRREKLARRN